MTEEEIVTDKQLDAAFGNANFGATTKRDILKNTLLKYACGYATGHTAKCIVYELSLITEKEKLTPKGKEYLWQAFNEGHSY